MSIKINGNVIEGELLLKGKLYEFTTDFTDFPLQLSRPDKVEVEFSNEILQCTVAESRVQNRYGQGKKRVLLLRVDSRMERAVAKESLVQKDVKPAVTKQFKKEVADLQESHKEVLKGLANKHEGSTLDTFLEEEGIKEEVDKAVSKKIKKSKKKGK
jgi:hypothetical protein